MRNEVAIKLDHVSKIYRLYGSQRDQLLDVLGFNRLGLKFTKPVKELNALDDISLTIHRGQRLGIIGRNGAGKTTLLKLICGNFMPTNGTVEVNGTVQALLSIGLGFHPDYTGRENVESSLQYNGLAEREQAAAMAGIIDFCELGDFIDQPFKTYSLGMQARLMFATATAIIPDILIVDEVLGAGDAYFVAKSKARVDDLIKSGCTMLLVSHSTQQVLELCDQVIWVNEGRIHMQGDALPVVKAYEEFLHGPIQRIARTPPDGSPTQPVSDVVMSPGARRATKGSHAASDEQTKPGGHGAPVMLRHDNLQEPFFRPHGQEVDLPASKQISTQLRYEAPGGISRWDSDEGLKLVGISILTARGEGNLLLTMAPAKFVLSLAAERSQQFDCRYGVALHDMRGQCRTRIFSPRDTFYITRGEIRQVEIVLNPVQIGPGEYTLGVSVLQYDRLENLNTTPRFDLLSRSFSLRVELPDSLRALEATFLHTAEWFFKSTSSN